MSRTVVAAVSAADDNGEAYDDDNDHGDDTAFCTTHREARDYIRHGLASLDVRLCV